MFNIFKKKPNLEASIDEARAYVARGGMAEALAIYDRLISAYPDSAAAYADRGTALAMAKKFQAAVSDLQKAVSLGYRHSSVYTSLATAQMELGDLSGAIAHFGAAAALDSRNALIYYNRATLLAKMGDKEGARRDLEQCLQLGPDTASESLIKQKLSALESMP